MSLIPWKGKRKTGATQDGDSTLSSFSAFRREMDRMFSRFFDGPWRGFDSPFAPLSGWTPSLDVVNGEKEITVRAEVPGVDAKDLDVSVSGTLLTISGEKKLEHQEKRRDYFRSERGFGSFRRTVQLPDEVDPEKISAEHANGVLTIRLAKSNVGAPKLIAITQR